MQFSLVFILTNWRNWTYTWDVVSIADSLREQPVPDLPGEDAGTLPLVLRDLPHHSRRGHPGLGAADSSGLDGASLVISEQGGVIVCQTLPAGLTVLPAEYLRDAAIGDLEYPGDITGPGPTVSQLHDLLPGGVRQGTAGHEDPAQLVDPAVTCSHQRLNCQISPLKHDKRHKISLKSKKYSSPWFFKKMDKERSKIVSQVSMFVINLK